MDSSIFNSNEYIAYQKMYLDLVPDVFLITALDDALLDFVAFFKNIDSEKLTYSYQEGKWTIKELIVHVIDTERVFQYRALGFARGDKTDFPGFSEQDYALNSNANKRALAALLDEFIAVRKSTITLFQSFDEKTLLLIGNANKSTMSIRAIAYLIVGHQMHHVAVVKKRYLT